MIGRVSCMLSCSEQLQVGWGLQLQETAHLIFEVSARDVKQVQQASHVIILEA